MHECLEETLAASIDRLPMGVQWLEIAPPKNKEDALPLYLPRQLLYST